MGRRESLAASRFSILFFSRMEEEARLEEEEERCAKKGFLDLRKKRHVGAGGQDAKKRETSSFHFFAPFSKSHFRDIFLYFFFLYLPYLTYALLIFLNGLQKFSRRK